VGGRWAVTVIRLPYLFILSVKDKAAVTQKRKEIASSTKWSTIDLWQERHESWWGTAADPSVDVQHAAGFLSTMPTTCDPKHTVMSSIEENLVETTPRLVFPANGIKLALLIVYSSTVPPSQGPTVLTGITVGVCCLLQTADPKLHVIIILCRTPSIVSCDVDAMFFWSPRPPAVPHCTLLVSELQQTERPACVVFSGV
jgi:hypothetical protein